MKIFLTIVVLITSCFGHVVNAFHLIDSLKLEARNGKSYIVHQVEPKETLFGIAKRYQTTVDIIKKENPQTLEGLKIGQQLSIPTAYTEPPTETTEIKHVVDIGETLYAISRKYKVEVDHIKEWNNLSSNELNVGQTLIIKTRDNAESSEIESVAPNPNRLSNFEPGSLFHLVKEKETLYALSKRYGVTVEDLRGWNNLSSNDLTVGQQLLVKNQKKEVKSTDAVEAPAEEPEKQITKTDTVTVPVIKASEVTEFNSRVVQDGALTKVLEEGMAQVIANSTDTRKYLALHRTADVGTVMRVKNLMNNLTIYVRVVGKLPGTGENNNLLLKISRTAFERLGGINKQFPVEVSYVP